VNKYRNYILYTKNITKCFMFRGSFRALAACPWARKGLVMPAVTVQQYAPYQILVLRNVRNTGILNT